MLIDLLTLTIHSFSGCYEFIAGKVKNNVMFFFSITELQHKHCIKQILGLTG